MSARCDLTNKGMMVGHKVSHSMIKTKRAFKVNLQNVSLFSQILGKAIKLKLSTQTLRTVDFHGGIDTFLTETSSTKLSAKGVRLKKLILKTKEGKVAANNNASEEVAQKQKKAA